MDFIGLILLGNFGGEDEFKVIGVHGRVGEFDGVSALVIGAGFVDVVLADGADFFAGLFNEGKHGFAAGDAFGERASQPGVKTASAGDADPELAVNASGKVIETARPRPFFDEINGGAGRARSGAEQLKEMRFVIGDFHGAGVGHGPRLERLEQQSGLSIDSHLISWLEDCMGG